MYTFPSFIIKKYFLSSFLTTRVKLPLLKLCSKKLKRCRYISIFFGSDRGTRRRRWESLEEKENRFGSKFLVIINNRKNGRSVSVPDLFKNIHNSQMDSLIILSSVLTKEISYIYIAEVIPNLNVTTAETLRLFQLLNPRRNASHETLSKIKESLKLNFLFFVSFMDLVVIGFLFFLFLFSLDVFRRRWEVTLRVGEELSTTRPTRYKLYTMNKWQKDKERTTRIWLWHNWQNTVTNVERKVETILIKFPIYH